MSAALKAVKLINSPFSEIQEIVAPTLNFVQIVAMGTLNIKSLPIGLVEAFSYPSVNCVSCTNLGLSWGRGLIYVL